MWQNSGAKACDTEIEPEMGESGRRGSRPLVGHGQIQRWCKSAANGVTGACPLVQQNSKKSALRISKCTWPLSSFFRSRQSFQPRDHFVRKARPGKWAKGYIRSVLSYGANYRSHIARRSQEFIHGRFATNSASTKSRGFPALKAPGIPVQGASAAADRSRESDSCAP